MLKSTVGSASNEVSCEFIVDINFSYVGRHKTCIMEKRTQIDSPDFTISSPVNEKVCGLRLNLNKKISFLPVKVDEKFPNLVGYSAQFCSIRSIHKENFNNLGKLKSLWLNRNLITNVPSDSFDDLESLQYLGLCKLHFLLHDFNSILITVFVSAYNKIKSINGALFEGKFIYLRKVFLERNECIDDNFSERNIVELLPQAINENCGLSRKRRR